VDATLRDRLQAGLTDAMKRRDTTEVKALRGALAAIANAESVAVPPSGGSGSPIVGAVVGLGAGETARKELSELDLLGIVDGEIQERLASARGYDELDEPGAADELRAEARVLGSYLSP
jgi:uncharacterized protein YqeY